MSSPANPPNTAPSLWDKAFNSLDADLRNRLDATKTHKRDILDAVLKEVEDRRAQSEDNRWKFNKPNGDTVIVRHVLEKIALWIKTFQTVGDVAVSFDPVHAALPWAAFRFLLRTVVSDVEVFGALVSDLETIAHIIARYREFEGLYLKGTKSDVELMLETTLTCLYGEILTHLARAVKIFQEGSKVRAIKSVFRLPSSEQMRKIHAQDDKALKLANLLNKGTLDSIETKIDSVAFALEDKYNKILDWISVLPYGNHHCVVSDSRLKTPGAGEWLLSHEEYTEWQASSSPSLFLLHGITGSGKSTLCSLVVDTWPSSVGNGPTPASLAYFYCANPEIDNTNRSSGDIMRAILRQLALDRTKAEVKECVVSEYDCQTARNKLDTPRLSTQRCVRLILELADEDSLVIIIDAIDTIEKGERHDLIAALKEIVSKSNNVVKIFVTSRTDSLTIATVAPNKQIQITTEETKKDMNVFVNQLVDNVVANNLLLGGDVSPALQKMMVQALIDGAGEMFLWVKLQVDRLCRANHEDDVKAALLNKLPESLEQLYQGAIDYTFDAGQRSRDIAVSVFSWILYMRETLTPSALLASLSTAEGGSTLQMAQVMTICANLVILDMKRNAVYFMHQSVREFLVRQETLAATSAHRLIASVCIEAVSRGLPSQEISGSPSCDFDVYAAMYWPVHTKLAEGMDDNESILDKVTTFIFDEDFDTTLSFESWLGMIRKISLSLTRDHVMKPGLDAIPNGDAGFLFLISIFGLNGLLDLVLSKLKDIDLNEPNELGHTTVYLASAFGHARTVSMLVNGGANLNVECGRHGSPLHAACFKGHLEVVETLLKLGGSTACGAIYGNALHAAFQGDQENVALRLIEHDGVITAEDDYEKALEGASRSGFLMAVKRLQSSHFDPFSKGQSKPDKLRKKIRKAIEGGVLNVLRQFLDTQANNKDALPPDAVSLATLYNHRDMVEFLLAQGASVEAEGAFGTPLRTASLLNYESLVRLLLDRGADINACGQFGDALQAAALKGHSSILKLLIKRNAMVNQKTGFFGTSLQAAAYHGRGDAVELLLKAGADVHAEGYSRDAFHAAAEGGHQDIIMTMLQRGYSFHRTPAGPMAQRSPTSPYKALLRDASPERGPHPNRTRWPPRIAENKNVNVERPVDDFHTIFTVAESESVSLQPGTKVASPSDRRPPFNTWGRENYPLWAAATAGHKGTVKVLLEQKETLGIPNEELRDALKSAASKSHLDVVQAILDDIAQRQPLSSYIKLIFNTGRDELRPQVMEFALVLADKHCSALEVEELKKQPATAAKKYLDPTINREELVSDFIKACVTGDTLLLSAIFGSNHQRALSQEDIDAGLQLCALHGQTSIAQMLLESSVFKGNLDISLEETFVTAAASGFRGMMEFLISYGPRTLNKSGSEAIQRSLVVSSKNGHIRVVRYLVEELLADVNISAPAKPISPSLSIEYLPPDIRMSSYGSRAGLNQQIRFISFVFGRRSIPSDETPVISPLRAVLLDDASFDDDDDDDDEDEDDYDDDDGGGGDFPHLTQDYRPRRAEQPQREEVLMFLLQNGANPNDLGGRDVYPIQLAAKFHPLHIVEAFISAGADVNLSENGETALFAAAGRELSAAPIVERLLAAGAIVPEEATNGEKLLNQALRYFKASTEPYGRHDNIDGCFLESRSLEYVFEEGPGAVLFNLLARMPHAKTSDTGWSLVLQMAAVLDHHPFVDLLLSRGTNVNDVAYYYGTALEGASRFGCTKMVQKLIGSGAQVNLIGGHWYTPLQAALAGGHESAVQILLDHGADTGLRYDGIYWHEIKSESVLQMGVRSRNLGIVKALLAKGVDVVHNFPETVHPLILAAQHGDVAITKELLDAGAPVSVRWSGHHSIVRTEEASPLHAAISYGHLNVIKLLVARGADIEMAFETGSEMGSKMRFRVYSDTESDIDSDMDIWHVPKPLYVAAAKGHVEAVRVLLSAGAAADDSKALSKAVKTGNVQIARNLIAAGSNPSLVFDLACREGRLDMLELLIEKVYDGEEPETVIDKAFASRGISDSGFRFLLDYARPTMRGFYRICAEGLIASATMLDMEGIDVNQPDENGDYPLQIAAANLQVEMVSFLLSYGAQVDCYFSERGTPLEMALEACAVPVLREAVQPEIATELIGKLSRPTDTWMCPQYIYTWEIQFYGPRLAPIGHQQISRCEKIVQLLVAQGAKVSNSSRALGPPFHLACLIRSRRIAQLLIDYGANVNEVSGYFERAIFAAILGRHSDIVTLLLEKDPQPNLVHSNYYTPLHLACKTGDAASVRRLLKYGADATAMDSEGHTPLTIALRHSHGPYLGDSHGDTAICALAEVATHLRLSDDDLVAATQLSSRNRGEILNSLLDLDKDMVISEHAICRVLEDLFGDEEIISLLMRRTGGIGVTVNMLKACRNKRTRQTLLKHRHKDSDTP